MTRTPTTLHEHFRADPRGADSFGKWIEDRVWELLQRPARVEFFGDDGLWRASMVWMPATAGACILDVAERCEGPANYWGFAAARVVQNDGTVIREWAAGGGATKNQASKAADRVGE